LKRKGLKGKSAAGISLAPVQLVRADEEDLNGLLEEISLDPTLPRFAATAGKKTFRWL
jgi:hypothetical protein